MPDQTPPAVSDAEVEALIGRFRHVADAPTCWVLAALSAAEEMLRRLLRDRQSAEARSAAGVEAAVREAARICDVLAETYSKDGDGPEAMAVLNAKEGIETLSGEPGAAALATLLAAARAEALREAMEALERKATAYAKMSNGVGDKPYHARTVMHIARAIVQDMLATPPAGGADDAA